MSKKEVIVWVLIISATLLIALLITYLLTYAAHQEHVIIRNVAPQHMSNFIEYEFGGVIPEDKWYLNTRFVATPTDEFFRRYYVWQLQLPQSDRVSIQNMRQSIRERHTQLDPFLR